MENLLVDEFILFYIAHYDKTFGRDAAEIALPPIKKIKHLLSEIYFKTDVSWKGDKNSKILEYGCSNGFNLRYLERAGFKNLYGVDAIYDYIDLTKEFKDSNIKYDCHNFSDTIMEMEWDKTPSVSYEEKGFDFIFTKSVLQEGSAGYGKVSVTNSDGDVKNILLKFKDILKDSGILILYEGQETRDWNKLSNEVGFDLFTMKERDIHLLRKKL